MNIVIYTANFGGRDPVRAPHALVEGCQYYCFSDRPLGGEVWSNIVQPAAPNPRIAARRVKILSHDFFPHADYVIWHDASMCIRGDINRLIDDCATSDIAAFPHRWRKCLYAEAQDRINTHADDANAIEQQMHRYRTDGFPPDFGLFETGVLVRRQTSGIRALNSRWWQEVRAGHGRDQLSFTYALWQMGIACRSLPGTVDENEFFDFDIWNHNPRIEMILRQRLAGVGDQTLCAKYGINQRSLELWSARYSHLLKSE